MIIFLDIDGVLNSVDYIISNHEKVLEFCGTNHDKNDVNILVKRKMLDLDMNKLNILKNIIIKLNAKVVIISSWKKLDIYTLIENELIKLGIPIIGITTDNIIDRGTGIKKYIIDNNIQDYIILDDEIFPDYDNELLSHLVKTSFYDGGLTIKHSKNILKKQLKC